MKRPHFRALLTRDATYPIRLLLDRCTPGFLRRSRLFMAPFFRIGFGKEHADLAMRFKDLASRMSDAELAALYRSLHGLSRYRRTDLNNACLRFILSKIDPRARTLLDAGCGNGAFLEEVHRLRGDMELSGCDLQEASAFAEARYVCANIERLPFPDKSFDVVTCHHTLEHVRDLPRAVSELARVAKRQLIITVPCQRYEEYTVDLHLQFFPDEASMRTQLNLPHAEVRKLRGDWVLIHALHDA